MSKALEALRNFISECENDWKTPPKRWVDGAINSNVSKYMDSLKSILTPPTADEVCKALSEYWGNPVQYDERHCLFEMYVGDNTWKPVELLRMRIEKPHIITLIGRFYEAQQ